MDIQIFQNFAIPSKMGIHILTNFNLPPIPTVSTNVSPKKRTAPVDSISGPSTKKNKVKSEDGQDQEVPVKQEQLDSPGATYTKPNYVASTTKPKNVKSEVEGSETSIKQEKLGDTQDMKSDSSGSNSRGVQGEESNAKSEEGREPYTGDFATRAEYAAYVRSLAAECGLHALKGFR